MKKIRTHSKTIFVILSEAKDLPQTFASIGSFVSLRMTNCVSIFIFLFVILYTLSLQAVLPLPKDLSEAVDGASLSYFLGKESGYVLTERTLIRFNAVTGTRLTEKKFGVGEKPLRLDLYDLNNDGREDAIVSLMSGMVLRSYVFRVGEGSAFETMVSRSPYFFRVSEIEGKKIVLGQMTSADNMFDGPITRMIFSGDEMVRAESLDLPKGIGIYEFAEGSVFSSGHFWARSPDGRLKRFDREGKKWKARFKTSEKYHGGPNCVMVSSEEVITENVMTPLCIPTPPVIWRGAAGEEAVMVDSHDYLLSGVILKPNMPRKAFMHMLDFYDIGTIKQCKQWGPYQTWIGDYFLQDKDTLAVMVNTGVKYSGTAKVGELKISYLDCKGEF